MNTLIIGYGSIGKRHFDILSSFKEVKQCHIISKQNISKTKSFKSLEDVNLNNYDYIVVTSKTNLHYSHLKYLENNTSNKIILVEKPIFHKLKDLEIKNNKVFVAYNRRYYPIIQKIKELLNKEKCYNINIITGQYLVDWRPERNYKDTYSAKKDEGGGVLLDLSHEIDYIQFLYGEIEVLSSINSKISDLDIDSDDYCTVLAKNKENTIINFTIDYITKEFTQSILINLKERSIFADLKKMTLKIVDKKGEEVLFDYSKFKRNYSFEEMHKDILENSSSNICCNYKEAINVMHKIEDIRKRNLYAS